LAPQICARHNAKAVHLGGSDRTDAVEFPDGEALNEARPHRGRDDELSVRFAVVGGEFGEELVVGNARRCREAGFIQDARPDLGGRRMRVPDTPFAMPAPGASSPKGCWSRSSRRTSKPSRNGKMLRETKPDGVAAFEGRCGTLNCTD
jgi:hypothetical protein